MKYQCDFYGCKSRCPDRAVIAFDDGSELHFFCDMHRWAMNKKYKDAYWIKDDAMEECPAIAHNRRHSDEHTVTTQDLRDTAKRLIAARDERLKDRLIMHALGIRWD